MEKFVIGALSLISAILSLGMVVYGIVFIKHHLKEHLDETREIRKLTKKSAWKSLGWSGAFMVGVGLTMIMGGLIWFFQTVV